MKLKAKSSTARQVGKFTFSVSGSVSKRPTSQFERLTSETLGASRFPGETDYLRLSERLDDQTPPPQTSPGACSKTRVVGAATRARFLVLWPTNSRARPLKD